MRASSRHRTSSPPLRNQQLIRMQPCHPLVLAKHGSQHYSGRLRSKAVLVMPGPAMSMCQHLVQQPLPHLLDLPPSLQAFHQPHSVPPLVPLDMMLHRSRDQLSKGTQERPAASDWAAGQSHGLRTGSQATRSATSMGGPSSDRPSRPLVPTPKPQLAGQLAVGSCGVRLLTEDCAFSWQSPEASHLLLSGLQVTMEPSGSLA